MPSLGVPNFFNQILQSLHNFQEEGLHCDVKLKASDGYEVHVHSLLLASCSHVFKSLLSLAPFSRKVYNVDCPIFTRELLGIFVKYIYTGEICVDQTNISATKKVFEYLEIAEAVEECVKFESKLNDSGIISETVEQGLKVPHENFILERNKDKQCNETRLVKCDLAKENPGLLPNVDQILNSIIRDAEEKVKYAHNNKAVSSKPPEICDSSDMELNDRCKTQSFIDRLCTKNTCNENPKYCERNRVVERTESQKEGSKEVCGHELAEFPHKKTMDSCGQAKYSGVIRKVKEEPRDYSEVTCFNQATQQVESIHTFRDTVQSLELPGISDMFSGGDNYQVHFPQECYNCHQVFNFKSELENHTRVCYRLPLTKVKQEIYPCDPAYSDCATTVENDTPLNSCMLTSRSGQKMDTSLFQSRVQQKSYQKGINPENGLSWTYYSSNNQPSERDETHEISKWLKMNFIEGDRFDKIPTWNLYHKYKEDHPNCWTSKNMLGRVMKFVFPNVRNMNTGKAGQYYYRLRWRMNAKNKLLYKCRTSTAYSPVSTMDTWHNQTLHHQSFRN